MRVAVIGLGFVGLSFASVLGSKGIPVIGVDSNGKKISSIKNGISPIYEPRLEKTLQLALKKALKVSQDISEAVKNSDLIFITVGTPLDKQGKIDLSMIKDVASKIGNELRKRRKFPVILVKSTVVPGTTEKIVKTTLEKKSHKKEGVGFGLITNPEFLREGTVIKDTINPHIVVIGGKDEKSIKIVKEFYKKFYNDRMRIIVTNPSSAELIKYANNTFLATKISFINQISNICQSLPDANIEDIAKAIGLDPRIGPLFLKAGPGFGGSCLPKDLQAIISFSSKMGIDPVFLKGVQKTNEIQLKKVFELIKEIFGSLKNKKITILGLSFKENSDDIRESISIKLIKLLLKKGAKIVVHDPKAMKNTKEIFKEKITYAESINESLNTSQCVVIMTPWKQYSKLSNQNFKKMKQKNVIDTRRLLESKKLDVRYKAIGKGN